MFDGSIKNYLPDFLIRMCDGSMLILEVKGMNTLKDRTKREFLDEWVKAVNTHGGFGVWKSAISRSPSDLPRILEKAVAGKEVTS